MTESINDIFSNKIQLVIKSYSSKRVKTNEILQQLMEQTIDYFEKQNGSKNKTKIREISLENFEEIIGSGYGVKRTKNSIVISEHIFQLEGKSKEHLINFILIKESLLHFLTDDITEIDETILNILAILFLKKIYEINTVDNPIMSPIFTRIYSTEIAGMGYLFWHSLLILLFSKDIDYIAVLNYYSKLRNDKLLSETDLINNFKKWVTEKTVQEIDVIAPIYMYNKLILTVETLLDQGYEKGSSSEIASIIKAHPNTIRSQYKELAESFYTFWRAEINYEMINLHNYFLKITIDNEDSFNKLLKFTESIPYLKTVFTGKINSNFIIYSPSLNCPHIISEQLSGKLRKLKDDGKILDYNLQMVREKYHFGTITNYPYIYSINTFKSLIEDDSRLTKLKFAHEKRDFSMEFNDEDVTFNYNLLYFLSLLKGKYLLKARYAMWVNELPKFNEYNKILSQDIVLQAKLFNKLELKARKRELLYYALYMRNFALRGSDTFVIELDSENSNLNDKLDAVIDRLKVFSFLGQINLYNYFILTIPNIAHNHPIAKVLEEVLKKEEIESSFYTIRLNKSNFIPLHKLFDFEEKSWNTSW